MPLPTPGISSNQSPTHFAEFQLHYYQGKARLVTVIDRDTYVSPTLSEIAELNDALLATLISGDYYMNKGDKETVNGNKFNY